MGRGPHGSSKRDDPNVQLGGQGSRWCSASAPACAAGRQTQCSAHPAALDKWPADTS